MTVCIYPEPEAEDYATVWGRVAIRDDESIWPDTRAIVERYVPSEGVEARMQQLRSQNRVNDPASELSYEARWADKEWIRPSDWHTYGARKAGNTSSIQRCNCAVG